MSGDTGLPPRQYPIEKNMTTNHSRIPYKRAEELGKRYGEIAAALRTTNPDDIGHQLPNLTESIRETSTEPDTVRFHVGVSFTEDLGPLDYYLKRVIDTERGRSVDDIKERASKRHLYLEFRYPPDPHFDVSALRGALLATIERDLHSIQDREEVETTEVSGLWKQLSGVLE